MYYHEFLNDFVNYLLIYPFCTGCVIITFVFFSLNFQDTIFNTKASVVNYLTVDPGFPLEDRTSAEVFLATLDGLMRGKSVSFFIPADGEWKCSGFGFLS